MERELDVTGQKCYVCNRGQAKVVHFVTEKGYDRFFFGCSNSTEAVPCPGMKAWKSITVPPGIKEAVFQEKGLNRPIKSRSARKEVQNIAETKEVDDWDEIIEEESTVRTKKTTKKKTKQHNDAAQWTRASDDDYYE